MSTRLYPLYQKGNPQLRIFLPNFWMKLIRGSPHQPPNTVKFVVSDEMSKYDIRNYLEKIYNIKAVMVTTTIVQGKFKEIPHLGWIGKEPDFKVAHVTLPIGTVFEFPDLYPKEKQVEEKKDEEKTLESMQESFQKLKKRNKLRPDVPGWFST